MLGNIVITGATGFLGSHFASEWLRSGGGGVFALVRDKGGESAASRFAAALEGVRRANGALEHVATERLTTVDGDVTRPLAGVAPGNVTEMQAAGVEVFWHFASDLRYETRHEAGTRRTNVDGARHALDLAVALGVKRFVYISTAFVCGRQEGMIEEEPVPAEREFSNGYEASKAEAERLLIATCERLEMRLTILRPSIVIGPRATQCAYGSETGLVSLVQAVMWIGSSQTGRAAKLRIPAWPEAEINFIPVDCVVADMMALAKAGFGEGRIYHLTSSSSVSVAECWGAIAEALGMHNVALVAPDGFEASAAERLIARRIGFFLSYIDRNRRFKRRLPGGSTLGAAEFGGYVRKAMERVERDAREKNCHAG